VVVVLGLVVVLAIIGAAFNLAAPAKKRQSRANAELASPAASRVAATQTVKTRKRRPLRANVVVTSSNFIEDRILGSSSIEYGVAVRNSSPSVDALNVVVRVHAIDRLGRSVGTDEQRITVIPAGGTFHFTGEIDANVSLSVARLRVVAAASRARAKSVRLPLASGVRVRIDGFTGEAVVTGEITNPYGNPLPEDATIYAVVLDRAGRFVGSASDVTGAQVRPGAAVSFNLTGFVSSRSARPLSAVISVDPCDGYFEDCGLVR
jgi:hypothetical protein